MSRRLMLAAGFAIVLMLTGCAATRLDPSAGKQIRNVAVVSLVSENISFNKTGLTVFNNETGKIDMGGSISATLEKVVAKHLTSTQPSWQIKALAYDREKLLNELVAKTKFTDSGSASTARAVTELAQHGGADALIVFVEGQTDYAPKGVGVRLGALSLSSIKFARITTTLFLVMVDKQGRVIAESNLDPGFRMDDIANPAAYGFKYKLEENYQPELMDRLKRDVLESVLKAGDRMLDQVGL